MKGNVEKQQTLSGANVASKAKVPHSLADLLNENHTDDVAEEYLGDADGHKAPELSDAEFQKILQQPKVAAAAKRILALQSKGEANLRKIAEELYAAEQHMDGAVRQTSFRRWAVEVIHLDDKYAYYLRDIGRMIGRLLEDGLPKKAANAICVSKLALMARLRDGNLQIKGSSVFLMLGTEQLNINNASVSQIREHLGRRVETKQLFDELQSTLDAILAETGEDKFREKIKQTRPDLISEVNDWLTAAAHNAAKRQGAVEKIKKTLERAESELTAAEKERSEALRWAKRLPKEPKLKPKPSSKKAKPGGKHKS